MQTEAKFTPETSAMPADTILKITKADLGADNFYVGATDVSDFDGSIEIAADLGRSAGFSVVAKWIEARLRIFAGLCAWREPTPEETEVRAELRNCTVAFGKHVAPTEVAE